LAFKTAKRFSLTLMLAFTLALAGCGANDAGSTKESQTVTDMLGRTVQIPLEVNKIAATGNSARMLIYAGCADKLIGVTDMDKKNLVEMPYSAVYAPLLANLPTVGSGGSKDITYYEEIISLKPDLIFSSLPLDAVNDIQQKTGIPVVALSYNGVFDQSVYDALELIGQIMGREERAATLVSQLKDWEKDLNERTSDIADAAKPKVYVGGVSFKGARGFEGTYANYPPFTAINAKNVADETGLKGAITVEKEKILSWNPDIIFINPANLNLIKEDYQKNKAFYDGLKAIKNDKAYSQPPYNYNGTNIEIAVADAYWAGKVIFPEKFADIDPAQKADEVFKAMLGESFYAKLQEKNLGFYQIKLGN